MSEAQLLVGPFNRVEGDLEIRLDVEAGCVRAAYVNSPLFRGFERMLVGKPAMDALAVIVGLVAWAAFAFYLHGVLIGVKPMGM